MECLSLLKYTSVLMRNKQYHFVLVYPLDSVLFVRSPKVVSNILVEKNNKLPNIFFLPAQVIYS